jgi:hypothetical protein
MKITKVYLKQIIKEELKKVNNKKKAVDRIKDTYPDIKVSLKGDTAIVYFHSDSPSAKASEKVKLGDSEPGNYKMLARAARDVLENTDMEPDKK